MRKVLTAIYNASNCDIQNPFFNKKLIFFKALLFSKIMFPSKKHNLVEKRSVPVICASYAKFYLFGAKDTE